MGRDIRKTSEPGFWAAGLGLKGAVMGELATPPSFGPLHHDHPQLGPGFVQCCEVRICICSSPQLTLARDSSTSLPGQRLRPPTEASLSFVVRGVPSHLVIMNSSYNPNS